MMDAKKDDHNKENEKAVQIQSVRKFSQPNMFGWTRLNFHIGENPVLIYMYDGRPFCEIEEIRLQLLKTKSMLGIDCFSFEKGFDSSRTYDSLQNGFHVLKEDISNGLEMLPIQIVSKSVTFPKHFEYITKNEFTESAPSLGGPLRQTCCDCTDNCIDKTKCRCWTYNIQRFDAYWEKKSDPASFGYQYKRLFDVIHTGIFECHEGCKCNEHCFNRVAQQPIGHRLELFKTNNLGWGVRCLNDIPRGTFVCCYIGEIMTHDEATNIFKQSNGPSYVFGISASANPPLSKREKNINNNKANDAGDTEPIVIDAKAKGNIARFFNHSCDPNVWGQNVFVDTHDLRFPRIAFFTSRLIEAGEQLTIDYYYDDDDDDGDLASGGRSHCKCGTDKCRGILL